MTSDDTPPPTAARIRAARLRAGLDERTMAERVGINLPSYFDLESYDDEIFTCLTLEEVTRLARALGITVRSLIASDPVGSPGAISMRDLVERVRQRVADQGITADALFERVGWDISPALDDPESAWRDWNIDCLRDVCAEIGVDWQSVVIP